MQPEPPPLVGLAEIAVLLGVSKRTATRYTMRGTFESTGHTPCALMGKRCAREAADAAELYLRTHREQAARTLPATSPDG